MYAPRTVDLNAQNHEALGNQEIYKMGFAGLVCFVVLAVV